MCSFNRLRSWRTNFGLWLELLLRIPDSVLWIYEPDGDGMMRQWRNCASITPLTDAAGSQQAQT